MTTASTAASLLQQRALCLSLILAGVLVCGCAGSRKIPDGATPDGGGKADTGGGKPDTGGGKPDTGGSKPDTGGSKPDKGPVKSITLVRFSTTDSSKGTQANPWKVGDQTVLTAVLQNIDYNTESVDYYTGKVGTAGTKTAGINAKTTGVNCSGKTCTLPGTWEAQFLCKSGSGKYQQFDRVVLVGDPTVSNSITWWSECSAGGP